MDSCIHSAWSWLSRSGIQNESGGVARFYSADVQEYRDISTQSTAFFISTFLRLGDHSQDFAPQEALRAGGFLLDRAFHRSKELFAHEVCGEDSSPSARAYFFDCSIIIRSLVDLWRATEEASLPRVRRTLWSSPCKTLCRGWTAHSSRSMILRGISPSTTERRGRPEAEVYQLKASLALQELTDATGLKEFVAHVRHPTSMVLEAARKLRAGFW